MTKRFYVYILANQKRGVLYIGITSDLVRRIAQHKMRAISSFTNTYGVTRLVYLEEFPSVVEARSREHTLKRWRRAWKFELIEEANPSWKDLSDEHAL